MRIFDVIYKGFLKSLNYKLIASYILLLQTFLALLLGILTYYYVADSIGNSIALRKILHGYDHDVFQDLLLYEGTGWKMIKSFMVAVCIIYLIVGPFISGGLLYSYHLRKDKWSVFWHGGSIFYASMLKINIVLFIIVTLFLTLLSWAGMQITNYGMDNFLSEVPILIILFGLLVLFVVLTIVSVSISTKSKWMVITQETKVWKALQRSGLLVWKKIFYYIFLGFLFILISAAFLFLSNFIINLIKEPSFVLILIALVLQVVFVYGRVLIRNAYYAAILDLNP